MAMSGIEIDPAITKLYNDIKIGHTNKWATFKIENKKKIVIDQTGEPNPTTTKEEDKESFLEFIKQIGEEPRYAVYDFRFTSSEGRLLEKLAFLFWSPDSGNIKLKMVYASSKDAIKKPFTGLAAAFEAHDRADLDYDAFAAELGKK